MEQAIEALRLLSAEVENGDRAALRTFIEFKRLEKELKQAMDIVQPLAVDEAERFDKKSFEHFGARIEVKNAASKWEYDTVYEIIQVEKRLEELKKLAQSASKLGGEVYDPNGVVIQPAKKIEGKTTIAVSVK